MWLGQKPPLLQISTAVSAQTQLCWNFLCREPGVLWGTVGRPIHHCHTEQQMNHSDAALTHTDVSQEAILWFWLCSAPQSAGKTEQRRATLPDNFLTTSWQLPFFFFLNIQTFNRWNPSSCRHSHTDDRMCVDDVSAADELTGNTLWLWTRVSWLAANVWCGVYLSTWNQMVWNSELRLWAQVWFVHMQKSLIWHGECIFSVI